MLTLADAHTEQPGLRGRRAIVTGGTTGIGRAIAVLLASEGATVFVCGRTAEHLDDALRRIREVGAGDGIALDLADPEGVPKLFESAEKFLGGIDVAVINAAVSADALRDSDLPTLRYQIEADFTSYLATAHEAAGRMQAGGDIVLIGSMSAVSRRGGASIYVAAKAGIQGFAQSLRQELAEKDIKVGLIEPGWVGTDFDPETPPDEQRKMIGEHKMLRAEDIAVAVHFMLTQPRRTAISLMRVEPRLKE